MKENSPFPHTLSFHLRICRKSRSHLFCLKLHNRSKKEHMSLSSGNKTTCSVPICSIPYHSVQNGTLLYIYDDVILSCSNHRHCKNDRSHNKVHPPFNLITPAWFTKGFLPLADMQISLLMRYGSQRNSSRQSMVHCPTTGFLPNGLWSITFSTMGGVYISSFGSS